jgi:hypothetical protein
LTGTRAAYQSPNKITSLLNPSQSCHFGCLVLLFQVKEMQRTPKNEMFQCAAKQQEMNQLSFLQKKIIYNYPISKCNGDYLKK